MFNLKLFSPNTATTVIYNGMCVVVPVTAWSVINQDWQLQIPIIDLSYKPWRLFLVVCGLPGFIAAIALTFLPESPKFVLSQGNKAAAYNILQKVNRWNNGRKSELENFEILDVIDNQQHTSESNGKIQTTLLKSIWSQTAPIFKPPYLKSTILLCTIQFSINSVFNGFFLFFPEIVNRMSFTLNSYIDDRMTMCDAIKMRTGNTSTIEHDGTNVVVSCLFKVPLFIQMM